MKGIRAWIALLLSLVLAVGSVMPVTAAEETEAVQEVIACADRDEAVVALRESMEKRRQTITVTFLSPVYDSQVPKDVYYAALDHTGVPTQGDYLRWGLRKCSIGIVAQEEAGQYRLTVTYTPVYYTTAEQESEMDAAVKALLDQLDVYKASDYEKVCAIYDYICANVIYDHWGLMTEDIMIYTPYAALIEKAAVCQGYATLFYRLALELGVDARVISGTSKNQNHGWNIVRLNGKYYNLDSTWDAEYAQKDRPYAYFLCSNANFENHTRKPDYATEEFMRVYPMADTDYAGQQPYLAGDLSGDGQLDETDVVYLLQYVLMPEAFPAVQAVDYTKDSRVNEDDVLYLLRHILLPESFPL